MNYFNNTRPAWLIWVLVGLNIATLAALWVSMNGPRHRGHTPEHVFRKELGLSDEQVEQFRELRKVHFEKTRKIHREIRDKKRKMFESLTNVGSDKSEAKLLAQEIGLLQANIDLLLIEHYQDLETICTGEQRQKLGKLFLRALPPPRGERRPKH